MPATQRHRVFWWALYFSTLVQTANAQPDHTYPVRSASYQVSGGLDETVRADLIKRMAAQGMTATFDGGTLTLTINSDGSGTISPSVKYQGGYKRGANESYIRYVDYVLAVTSCAADQSSCAGTWKATSYHIYNNNRTEEPSSSGRWTAQLQKDGTYLLPIPNGNPPNWGDIPYRLGGAGPPPGDTDKVSITTIKPEAGKRQDPFGTFRPLQADVAYELGTRDAAWLAITIEDQTGEILRTSPLADVARGKGTVRLETLNTPIPRGATALNVKAVLIAKDSTELAQSAVARYPVEFDLRVDHVEVIQAVQDAQNSIPLIANKATYVRLFAVAKELNDLIDGVKWVIRGYRDGRELAGSPLVVGELGAFIGTDVDRESPSALWVTIPTTWVTPGTLDLRVEVNPKGDGHMNETNGADNLYNLQVEFQERPPLDVRYRLICIEPPGETSPVCATGDHDAADMALVIDRFPVQLDRFTYEALPIVPKRWRHPMTTAGDWDRLIIEMQVFYRLHSAGGRNYQQLVGWLPATARATLDEGSTIRGLTLPVAFGGTGRVVLAAERGPNESLQGLAYVLSHEMGHNFGLTHPGSPPTCQESDATLVTGEINMILGWFKGSKTYHLMSMCDIEAGIRPDQYLTVRKSGFQPAGAAAATAQPKNKAPRTADPQGGECLLVQGTVARQTASARFDQVLRVSCSEQLAAPEGGDHCLRFYNGADALPGDRCFPVSFHFRESAITLEERSFFVEAPLPAGTTRFALLRDGQELASRSASANPPTIRFTAPANGSRWTGGTMDLAWSAADPDGDALSFVLQYSYDGGSSWLPLEIGLTETGYSFDTKYIQGGKNVMFRVTASDGFFVASADAGPLEVVQTPAVSVTPKELDFLNVLLGHSAALTLTVYNTGSGPVNIQSISTVHPFAVSETGPLRIPAGSKRALTVRFLAGAAGLVNGSLILTTDDPANATIQVALAGTGVEVNTPAIEPTPASLDFGNLETGKTAELSVRVRNRGPAALTVISVAASPSVFRVAALTKAALLKAGESLDVTVAFAPSAAGAVSGNLTVSSDDPIRGSLQIALKGTGQAAPSPSLTWTPPNLDFGSVIVGQSKELGITFSNTGTAQLVITSIASDNPRFVPSVSATTAAVGASTTVTVRFTPAEAGRQTANLTVLSNDPAKGSVKLPLTGTGTAVSAADVVLKVDGGSFNKKLGFTDGLDVAMFVNRLTPPSYPATLKNVQIFFSNRSDGLSANASIRVIVATNPSGSANLLTPAMVAAGGTMFSLATTVTALNAFNSYVAPADTTINSGDFVVGFATVNPPKIMPADLDMLTPSQKRSYVSTDGGITFELLDNYGADVAGNLGIRAVVTLGSPAKP